MKKATVLFFATMVIIIDVFIFMTDKDDFVPYEKVLARKINSSTLHSFHDTNFNIEIKVPGMFIIEEDTSNIAYSYARFAYYPKASYIDAKGQIIIEYYASVCADNIIWKEKIDSISHSGNYVTYAKSIRRQRMKFTYSLTYPATYETCVSRLKKEIREWKAFNSNRPKQKSTINVHRKHAKMYNSGFAKE